MTTFKLLADRISELELRPESIKFKKGHQLPVTCLSMAFDGSCFFTGSKDCCVTQCMFCAK
jgi:hypothetical protein